MFFFINRNTHSHFIVLSLFLLQQSLQIIIHYIIQIINNYRAHSGVLLRVRDLVEGVFYHETYLPATRAAARPTTRPAARSAARPTTTRPATRQSRRSL